MNEKGEILRKVEGGGGENVEDCGDHGEDVEDCGDHGEDGDDC